MNGARLALLSCGAMLCAGLAVSVLAACGDGPDAPGAATADTPRAISTGGVAGGPEPLVPGPAGRYIPPREDLKGSQFRINPFETFAFTTDSFANNQLFKDPEEGQKFIQDYRYGEGYQVYFEPDGLLAGVLTGKYFATVEAHLFASQGGASAGFKKFTEQSEKTAKTERLSPAALGNDFSAFKLLTGQAVGSSNVKEVYYRFIFRRGNLLGVVQVYGGDGLLTIDAARDIALSMDERALGRKPAPPPTPLPRPSIGPVLPNGPGTVTR
jgi:hypothetical protein